MDCFPGVIFEFAYDASAGLGPSLQHAFGSPGGDPHPAVVSAPGVLTNVFIPRRLTKRLVYAVTDLAAAVDATVTRDPLPTKENPRKPTPDPYEQESF
jgi:hypothetical protein